MSEKRFSIRVPNSLIVGLEENGVSKVVEFLELFLSRIEAEELIDWNQEYEEVEVIEDPYGDEGDFIDDDDDDDDDDWDDGDDEF